MITSLEEEVITCPIHNVKYNSKESPICPICKSEKVEPIKFPPVHYPVRRKELEFKCPYCPGRSKFPRSCSRYYCRKKAGLTAYGREATVMFRCILCGGRTKYESRICAKYQCRQKAGTQGMYNK
jgi:hypothetical protein